MHGDAAAAKAKAKARRGGLAAEAGEGADAARREAEREAERVARRDP